MGYTTASWSCPLGSYVLVTNLYNGHRVVLRVNDRGPAAFTGRCVDVSLAGAYALGFTYAGHTIVTVEPLY
jgi:rare lipoprotein A